MSKNYKDTIRKEVNSLAKLTQEKFEKHICNKINKLILESMIVTNKNTIIFPYWVEAYYHYKSKNWKCGAMHNNRIGYPDQQGLKNQFKLYFHKSGRGGVDLVLSNNDISLSILLKCTVVDNKCISQTALRERLNNENTGEVELKQKNTSENLLFAKRVGIKSNKAKNKILATYINIGGLNKEAKCLNSKYLYNKMRKILK